MHRSHDQFQWSSQVVGQYLESWCNPIEIPVFKPIIILLTYKTTRESEKKLGWQRDNSGEKKKKIDTRISVQLSQSCPTLCNPMDCSMPGFPFHHQLPELTQTHVHWVGGAIQPSHPQLSLSPPAFNLPSIRVFSSESVLCIRWPKYWSFSFSISPFNEHPGLISFRMDWLDLLAGPRDSQESSATPQFKSINSSTRIWNIVKSIKIPFIFPHKYVYKK